MRESLLFWNPWWRPDFNTTKLDLKDRLIKNAIMPLFERKEILTITGVRRAGKTRLLFLLIKDLLNEIDAKNILYLNLEDETLSPYSLEELYKQYKAFMKPKGKVFLFFDEIQNVEAWEKWVRKMYDSFAEVKITLTGSNSVLTKQEYASLFTGRMLNFELYPLSFEEFLGFKKFITDKFTFVEKQEEVKELLREYLIYGGFPEVALENDVTKKILLMKNYFETIRDKDIIKQFKLKEYKKFERLTFFLSSNLAKEVSAKGLAGVVKLSPSVVNNYFDLLEMAYFFFFLNHFAYSIKSQITFPRKCYCVDTGLSNAVSFKFSENLGRVYENAVFLELKRRQTLNPMTEIYYWKNPQQQEVDFVIKQGLKVNQLVQVCYNINDLKTKKREIRALKKAYKEFKCRNILIITEDYEAEEKIDTMKIKFIPLWKWLLTTICN